MSLTVPQSLLEHTEHEPLLAHHKTYGDTVTLRTDELDDAMLSAISAAADAAGERGTQRVVDAIVAARAGQFDKAIPSLKAAPEILIAYFRANLSDGWIYKRDIDGHLHAWLVEQVQYVEGRNPGDRPSVHISLVANGKTGGRRRDGDSVIGVVRSGIYLSGDVVARKKVSDVLQREGVYVETPDLRADYDTARAAYEQALSEGFTHQYRFTGKPIETESYLDSEARTHRKVIHDVAHSEIAAPADFVLSVLFGAADTTSGKRHAKADDVDTDEEGLAPVPTHFALRVFDLAAQDFIWVNTRDLERYVYDPTLAEKIVLPADQRNLLEILTADLSDFTGDVIEGKSTGNVILCKGAPGVGKTLTAEVYSEVIGRPLYSIHSGNLGVQADDVRKNLETTFKRAKRWNAVLLLDEADVFVLERGSNITQNAIVAEFLRTLEYFDGLLFMTTNRADNIDDAILSRAAAIIDYKIPDLDGIRQVWKVQAANQDTTLDDALLDDLVTGFETIAPRDVKMLLRLALRVSKGSDTALDVDTFARCGMFRGLHYKKGSRTA